jgi:hypothetical protein
VLQRRFDPSVQRVASGLFLITRTAADGLRVFLTALLLQFVLGGVGPAIVVVGVVTIVYTYLGGMKAVIWTDLIQFVIKVAGAALAGVFVLTLLPGGWDQFLAGGEAAGKFRLIDAEFRPAVAFNLWAGVLAGRCSRWRATAPTSSWCSGTCARSRSGRPVWRWSERVRGGGPVPPVPRGRRRDVPVASGGRVPRGGRAAE